ncbi:hypothetical protein NIES4071_18000 [Calothrix sp. NIES-4071]|nr:hypothetical protein NIES4071_18000 [Calothrix sp. NIES-4071]BAZ56133.1 hypothetical protein NIES4105_17950 [Calothrix sp. NIES-4105]
MAISKTEAKKLLERLIFDTDRPQDWIEDIWSLSPTLGEDAAKLVEVFEALIECCPQEKLENLVNFYCREAMES